MSQTEHWPSDFTQKTLKKMKICFASGFFQIMQIICVFSFMKISFSKGQNVNFTYQVWLFGLVFTNVNK